MSDEQDLVAYWPLFGLRVETPRLVLRVGRDTDFAEALGLIDAGIHDPAVMPFKMPWTDDPGPVREKRSLQYWWSTRASLAPGKWNLELFVFVEGAFIGVQAIHATDFGTLREAGTGSWLGRAHHGRGYGTEMRSAVLELGFAHLDARAMTSGAFFDNSASIRVSRALGYEDNGIELKAPRGEPRPVQRFRLTRERWEQVRRPIDVRVTGLEPCLVQLGVTP